MPSITVADYWLTVQKLRRENAELKRREAELGVALDIYIDFALLTRDTVANARRWSAAWKADSSCRSAVRGRS